MILHNERKLFNNTNFIMQVLTVWLFVEFVEAHLKVYGLLISNTVTTNFVRAIQTLDVLNSFKKRFCSMSGLKFSLSGVTSFLTDNLSGLNKNIFKLDFLKSYLIY